LRIVQAGIEPETSSLSLFFIIANDGIRRIVSGGYPVDSGSPYTLWFGSGLRGGWLNDPVMVNRIDGRRLLRQTQMGFWGYL
jgi:hypothetical protein